MEPKVLYNLGASAVNGQSIFLTVALVAATIGCLFVLVRRRRAGTLSPELRFLLITSAVLIGGSAVLFSFSFVPDIVQAPVVERGRILRVYSRKPGPEEAPVTHVALSNGADVQIPDPLMDQMRPGLCVEITRTPATSYILIAKQLAPEDCLK